MAATAGAAMPAAFFRRLAGRRPHLARPAALGLVFAVGAQYFVVEFIYKFFKFLAAFRASVLQYRHQFLFLVRFCFLCFLVAGVEDMNLTSTNPTSAVSATVAPASTAGTASGTFPAFSASV